MTRSAAVQTSVRSAWPAGCCNQPSPRVYRIHSNVLRVVKENTCARRLAVSQPRTDRLEACPSVQQPAAARLRASTTTQGAVDLGLLLKLQQGASTFCTEEDFAQHRRIGASVGLGWCRRLLRAQPSATQTCRWPASSETLRDSRSFSPTHCAGLLCSPNQHAGCSRHRICLADVHAGLARFVHLAGESAPGSGRTDKRSCWMPLRHTAATRYLRACAVHAVRFVSQDLLWHRSAFPAAAALPSVCPSA